MNLISLGIALSLAACGQHRTDAVQADIHSKVRTEMAAPAADDIYGFSFTTLSGEKKSFADYKGKKILIVNTASMCGYTPQYGDLEKLYEMKKDRLVIVAFPSNSFMQEHGKNEKIGEVCEKFSVSFPVSQPVEVRGNNIDPVFKWLTEQPNLDFTGNIKWNFEKFLVDEQGKLIHRYRSATTPLDENITGVI